MSKHKYPYRWNLADGYTETNGLNVFGTFICGGGSTMGYKLAGFNHLGGVEIDPKVADVYKENHNPKYLYVEDIRDFVKRTDLPKELYNLDILDGSPPCSSFSMAGNREKDWGKEKVFKEGQKLQVLDDLFFEFIALTKKLQPKVAIAENVKGLIQGNAKNYVHKIKAGFEDAGYKVQLFLLNAASMGVPQKRERVFFICQRNDLNLPKLVLNFNEKPILFKLLSEDVKECNLTKKYIEYWKGTKQGESVGKFAALKKLKMDDVSFTITSGDSYHPTQIRTLSKNEYCKIGSFPLDYNFKNIQPKYLIGMSVPPCMVANISLKIKEQWFSLTTEQQRNNGQER